jgi:hypothetical protein
LARGEDLPGSICANGEAWPLSRGACAVAGIAKPTLAANAAIMRGFMTSPFV